MISKLHLYRAVADADKAWTEELLRVFGRDAGLARYQGRGIGEEGTSLRALSDAMFAAEAALKAQ